MSDTLPSSLARRRSRLLARSVIALLALSHGARAADQIRHEAATVTLRLLPADETGEVRGALVIDLEPGWKTYWIAPGPVGLAPDLRFDRSAGLGPVAVDYPVPIRFHEGSDVSVGYDAPTAFALRSSLATGASPVLRADLLLGVCREICVPLQASLEARPDPGLSSQAAVASAFAALPDEAPTSSTIAARLSPDGREIAVTTDLPRTDGALAALFVGGPAGWTFGLPVAHDDPAHPGMLAFTIPVERRSVGPSGSLHVDLLLTSGETARLSRSLAVSLP
ncbi:protein-disulfide reductase DsbD domain-containing protein [Aureimonas pseudogalii]|uniref:DsbC/DsbD-like thiol-disulfide interchange protein n=1 Tax=Aureimonas pseudogalii TaxID=1744844 RepID=A0A7W6MK84_9HYPH|nr:protein-disulfide reductase DsbD domain-containing protein [Aureimonas pseudogalii]MBB3998820.1 DsbC/DsbD-like thiol-disulfide interchange protein [Aureimonas pseudogalii]